MCVMQNYVLIMYCVCYYYILGILYNMLLLYIIMFLMQN